MIAKATKALVVLSGGQDSTTCLAMAIKEHDEVHAITMNYGQRHAREIQAASDVALLCGVSHEVINLGPFLLAGTSPLTDPSQPLEQYSDFKSMDGIIGDRVEKTFVPMRNALFLTIAANRAAVLGCTMIYTGVCEADNANYPDCRADFIRCQEVTINQALGNRMPFENDPEPNYITIETPLMRMSKAKSIEFMNFALNQLDLLAFTHTAYDGQYPPVGKDHATLLRAQGFLEAGIPDPLIVRACMEGLMDWPLEANYRGRWGPGELETQQLGECIFALKHTLIAARRKQAEGTVVAGSAEHIGGVVNALVRAA